MGDEFLSGKDDAITVGLVPRPENNGTFLTYDFSLSGIQVVAGTQTLKDTPLPDNFSAVFDSGASMIKLPKSVCEAIKSNSDKKGLELRFLLGRNGSQMLKLPLSLELARSTVITVGDVTFVNTAWGPFQCGPVNQQLSAGLHLMRWFDMAYNLEKMEMTFVPKKPILRLKFGTEEPRPFWVRIFTWIWTAIGGIFTWILAAIGVVVTVVISIICWFPRRMGWVRDYRGSKDLKTQPEFAQA